MLVCSSELTGFDIRLLLDSELDEVTGGGLLSSIVASLDDQLGPGLNLFPLGQGLAVLANQASTAVQGLLASAATAISDLL